MKLVYRFRLSDEEFSRAWLREYYRRPGWRGFRVAGGPMIAALGLAAMVRAADTFTLLMGGLAVLLGVWLTVKPWLAASMIRKQRQAAGRAEEPITLTLSDSGLTIDNGRTRTELSWSDVSASGRGPDYVWYAIGGGARATIPLRAVDDPAALEELLRRRARWRG